MNETPIPPVGRAAFVEAGARSGLTREAAEALWLELGHAPPREAGSGLRREAAAFPQRTRLSRTVRVLLYVGAFLVIGSYGWWARRLDVGISGLLALSLVYGGGFLAAALWAQRRELEELVAAAATVAAFYVAAVLYAALRLAGFDFGFHEDVSAFYEWISGGWVWLELAAIAGTLALYRRFRAPLLGLPLSLFTTLFLAMDGTARVTGIDHDPGARTIGALVLLFGALAVAAGAALDYRGLRRHAFWPHVFGALGLVSGLECLLAEDSYQLALVLAGAAFLALGIWLGRAAYLVSGGLALWVGISLVEPSPVLLTGSGLLLVAGAVWLSLASSPLRRWLGERTLPAPQRD